MSTTVLRPTASTDIASGPAERRFYRSDAEQAIREVVEAWLRERLSGARVMHEVNMCQGGARVDLLGIGAAHMIGIEIKGPWDSADRLIGQIAAFRMALPELWLISAGQSATEATYVQYLFPSVGIAEIRHSDLPATANIDKHYRDAWGSNGRTVDRDKLSLHVVQDAATVQPLGRALLNMLWVEELRRAAGEARLWQGKAGTHGKLCEALAQLGPTEKIAAACKELRSRPTLHRADEPIASPALKE